MLIVALLEDLDDMLPTQSFVSSNQHKELICGLELDFADVECSREKVDLRVHFHY